MFRPESWVCLKENTLIPEGNICCTLEGSLSVGVQNIKNMHHFRLSNQNPGFLSKENKKTYKDLATIIFTEA